MHRRLLLLGALAALMIHVAAMHVPLMQDVLGTQPASTATWLTNTFGPCTDVPETATDRLWSIPSVRSVLHFSRPRRSTP